MNATEVLAEAKRIGLVLKAEGGEVRYWPRHAMPPLLAAWIRSMKAEILDLLSGGAAQRPQLPPTARDYDRKTVAGPDAGIACECGARVLKGIPVRDGTTEPWTCKSCGKVNYPPPF
jgi:hypothetical protein